MRAAFDLLQTLETAGGLFTWAIDFLTGNPLLAILLIVPIAGALLAFILGIFKG